MYLLSSAWRDLRFATRTLAKSRGFLAVAVFCLALGIGANSTMFSLVDGFWMRPLPVRDPGSLVYLSTNTPREGMDGLSYAEFLDYRKQATSFAGLIATERRGPTLSGEGYAESTMSNVVSENYFTVLGVGAQLGRVFTEADAGSGQRVAVMSYNLWQRRFGGDPNIVGRTLRLSGSYQVIGVAPKGFRGTELWQDSDFWIPISSWDPSGAEQASREYRSQDVMGRLRAGVTMDRARGEVAAIAGRLEQAYPKYNRGCRGVLLTAREYLNQRMRVIPYLLLGIVGLVLLIACANLANLLLARAGSRTHEIAVRLAMGARRGRLVQQLMAENALICALGTGAGLLLARWLIAVLPSVIIPPAAGAYIHLDLRLDHRVLAFTLLMSVVTVFLFGLAPALRASRPDLMTAIRGGSADAGGGRRRVHVRSLLVVAQVALSMMLLTGAGLLIRTFVYSLNLDLGFARRDLLVANIASPYDGRRSHEFYRQVLERVRAMPGMGDATLALRAPLSGSGGGLAQGIRIAGRPAAPGEAAPRVKYTAIDWNYFHALGIRLLRGRVFDAHDAPESQPVLVVNETMARRFWPGEDPIGKTVRLDNEPGRERTIVGVVNDARVNNVMEEPEPYFYLPFEQTRFENVYLIAATRTDPLRLAKPLRAEVAAVDKRAPVLEVTSMKLLVRSALFEQQVAATVVGALGGMGLLLAAVGLYGLISQSVTERTREIGIRMALGAQRANAMTMVLRQGVGLVLIGAVIGLAGSIFAMGLLKELIYGVSVHDPATFAAVVALLLLVAALASLLPARRATRIEPTEALRYE
jgi:predicted permease